MSSRIVVLISGGGTNLQAIIDACKSPAFPGTVVGVVSNKSDAYGLTRAQNANIETTSLSHKDFESRESYDKHLHETKPFTKSKTHDHNQQNVNISLQNKAFGAFRLARSMKSIEKLSICMVRDQKPLYKLGFSIFCLLKSTKCFILQ